MHKVDSVPFVNVQNNAGRYALYFCMPDNQLCRVERIGYACQPFVLVSMFKDQACALVQRIGNVRNENDMRLYLIDVRTGNVVSGCESGASRVVFDSRKKNLFFTPLMSSGRIAQKFSWCLPRVGQSFMAINVPAAFQPGVLEKDARQVYTSVAEITVIDFVPRRKSVVVKAKTGDVKVKRKRGRPKGVKNKNKFIGMENTVRTSSVAVQKKVKSRPIKQHRVSLRPVKRNLVGTLYDVYINGRRVASQRLDARAQTFMDNRILAVAYKNVGTVCMSYDVYWPDTTQWKSVQSNKYTGMLVGINDVLPVDTGLRLGLDNNSYQFITDSQLKHFAMQQFVIENQKTR